MKFLISLTIIFLSYSCKDVQNNQIKSKLNEGIKKIEKIVDKKDLKNNSLKKKLNNKESIFYYVGEPYFIDGVQYIPEENYNYSEIGIAKFYGKEKHNLKTINNDINKVTELLGRHKTLPLPSIVKITNLDNGLSITIKIIDRHDDNASIIEVSRKVAQLLGFYKDKVATVRIDILSDASKQWKNVSLSLNEPEFNDTISSAPTELVSITNIDNSIVIDEENNLKLTNPVELSSEEVQNYNMFLKILNFNKYSDIKKIMENLSSDFNYTSERNGSNYDLILGPLDKTEIKNLVSYFISKGYKETKIIIN